MVPAAASASGVQRIRHPAPQVRQRLEVPQARGPQTPSKSQPFQPPAVQWRCGRPLIDRARGRSRWPSAPGRPRRLGQPLFTSCSVRKFHSVSAQISQYWLPCEFCQRPSGQTRRLLRRRLLKRPLTDGSSSGPRWTNHTTASHGDATSSAPAVFMHQLARALRLLPSNGRHQDLLAVTSAPGVVFTPVRSLDKSRKQRGTSFKALENDRAVRISSF